jgi:L-2-hydroxyglutarate oxidase LhgO
MSNTADFLVIGGGVIGLNLALAIKQRYPEDRVTLLDKEKAFGLHASGRNSGVLHAGFYYTADSLKARFTREGNRLLTKYCEDRNLRINRCGKLVVAKGPEDLNGLDELLQRARHNDVDLYEVTEKEAREIEPRVKTYDRALFSPTTSSVNPCQVMESLVSDAEDAGIQLLPDTAYVSKKREAICTTKGLISAGFIVNAAGLYADKIARDFGFSEDYQVLPFKGLYLYGNEPPGSMRTNLYPVPNLKNPFLGVHFTVTVEGKIKIGPTATPALWREHYEGLSNFKLSELLEILGWEIKLFLKDDFGFRQLAFDEIQKHFKSRMVEQASRLAEGVRKEHYTKWVKPGIRAQLLNIKDRKLEMDFRIEGDERSLHVLNAVSPAFTCSIPFSKYVIEQIACIHG